MIRAFIVRAALRQYIKLGVFIAKNADLLSPHEIARLHEEGRWTQANARRVHRKRREAKQ